MGIETYEQMGPRARAVMDELVAQGEVRHEVRIDDIADDFMIQVAKDTVRLVLDAPFAFEGAVANYVTGEIKPEWDELGPAVAERALMTCLAIERAVATVWDDVHRPSAIESQQKAMKPILRLVIADWQDEREALASGEYVGRRK